MAALQIDNLEIRNSIDEDVSACNVCHAELVEASLSFVVTPRISICRAAILAAFAYTDGQNARPTIPSGHPVRHSFSDGGCLRNLLAIANPIVHKSTRHTVRSLSSWAIGLAMARRFR